MKECNGTGLLSMFVCVFVYTEWVTDSNVYYKGEKKGVGQILHGWLVKGRLQKLSRPQYRRRLGCVFVNTPSFTPWVYENILRHWFSSQSRSDVLGLYLLLMGQSKGVIKRCKHFRKKKKLRLHHRLQSVFIKAQFNLEYENNWLIQTKIYFFQLLPHKTGWFTEHFFRPRLQPNP